MRDALATHLRAADPLRYAGYRRRAWELLHQELLQAAPRDIWRYTADVVYFIENPVVREAFFPRGAPVLPVEQAVARDGPRIASIIDRHEGPDGAADLHRWWDLQPGAYRVARGADGDPAGFYVLAERARVHKTIAKDDRVIASWLRHLRDHPVADDEQVLFARRWLDEQRGELFSQTQAAVWLDVKGQYVEMRRGLRRIYLTVTDYDAYREAAQSLGFQRLDDYSVDVDGRRHWSACLDFGPDHVDGWLGSHVRRELGVQVAPLIDYDAREICDGDGRVPLSPLEFGVLSLLDSRRGRPVSRADLVEHVWGYSSDGASNVVEVVVRSLRKKLGTRAGELETVRGVGYRLRQEQP